MNKAVIFDLDGTLIDSLPDIVDNLNLMLTHYGYPTVTISDTKPRIGYGARHLVKKSIPQELADCDLDERLEYYNHFYTTSGSPKTGLFAGVPEMLRQLKNRGYKLAILTNKPHETTVNVYDEYLKDFSFDSVVGASNTVKHKPNPDGVFKILSDLNVESENAYFIGDGETDVITANNANVKSIAVTWGYRDKTCLTDAGATLFANSPQEILDLLK